MTEIRPLARATSVAGDKETKRTTISTVVEPEIKHRLAVAAHACNMGFSELVREILEAGLLKYEEAIREVREEMKKGK